MVTRQIVLKTKGNNAGKDVYVKERSTVRLSKEVGRLNYELKMAKRSIKAKEKVIEKQIDLLDQYREDEKI